MILIYIRWNYFLEKICFLGFQNNFQLVNALNYSNNFFVISTYRKMQIVFQFKSSQNININFLWQRIQKTICFLLKIKIINYFICTNKIDKPIVLTIYKKNYFAAEISLKTKKKLRIADIHCKLEWAIAFIFFVSFVHDSLLTLLTLYAIFFPVNIILVT